LKIKQAIDDYRAKEEEFKKKMEGHSQIMGDIEQRLRKVMDGPLAKIMKEAEVERTKYQKVESNIQDLTSKIKLFMGNFEKVKDDIALNNTKFEEYNQKIEERKLKINVL
jgi:hypothetical protein